MKKGIIRFPNKRDEVSKMSKFIEFTVCLILLVMLIGIASFTLSKSISVLFEIDFGFFRGLSILTIITILKIALQINYLK